MAEKKAKPKAKAKAEKKTIDMDVFTEKCREFSNQNKELLTALADEPKAEDQTGAFDAVQLPEVELSPELEAQINEPAIQPPPMMTASDLAQMARNAKAGKADMQEVIKAHEAYLKAIAQGAIAPAADVEFVKNHMKYLKTL